MPRELPPEVPQLVVVRRIVAMKILGTIAGGILLVVGLVGSGVGVFALLDPSGTKMSDDADPFGPAPSILNSSLLLCFYLFIAGVGVFLLWKSLRKPRVPPNPPLARTAGCSVESL